MKTNYERLQEYLQIEPRARERKNKNRAIGNVILEDYYLDIPKQTMSEIVAEILTYDRVWRKILEENPALRGMDYLDKQKLENEIVSVLYPSAYGKK